MKPGVARVPDGVSAEDFKPRRASDHASPAALVILGAVIAAGLSGFLGDRHATITSRGASAVLSVRTPSVLRTGESFETSIEVVASAPIAELVIAVSPGLWKGITLNSMTPGADREAYEDDSFRFSYGRLRKDQTMMVEIDGQVNPSLAGVNRGLISVRDGDRELVSVPVSMRVLP